MISRSSTDEVIYVSWNVYKNHIVIMQGNPENSGMSRQLLDSSFDFKS